jgi:hypothetical protein
MNVREGWPGYLVNYCYVVAPGPVNVILDRG